jgi:uncharacterized protein (TIGR02246 family)
MPKLRTFLFPALLLVAVGCEPGADTAGSDATPDTSPQVTPPGVDTTAIFDQVTRMRESWVRSAEARDAAAVAGMYADDAVMVGSTGERMEGRQAIEQGLAGSLDGLSNMHVTSVATEVGTDLVADMGTYTQIFQGPEGEQTVHGYYHVVARRQPDGSLRVVQHLGGPFAGAAIEDTPAGSRPAGTPADTL